MVMLWQRMKRVVTAQAHSQVDAMEDPAQMMNQVLREQVCTVQKGKAAVKRAEMFRRQIEAHIAKEQKAIDEYARLARLALEDEKVDRAKSAIRRKQESERRLEELSHQLARAKNMEERQLRVLDKMRADLDELREKRQMVVQRTWLQQGMRDLQGMHVIGESHTEVVARMEEKTLMADASMDALLNMDEAEDLDLRNYGRDLSVEQELAALQLEAAEAQK